MKLLVCIVPEEMVEPVTQIVAKGLLDYQIGFPVQGTAKQDMLEFFSLHATNRHLVLSLVDTNDIARIFKQLNEELQFEKRGSGVAFTVSLNRIPKNDYTLLHSESKEETAHG